MVGRKPYYPESRAKSVLPDSPPINRIVGNHKINARKLELHLYGKPLSALGDYVKA